MKDEETVRNYREREELKQERIIKQACFKAACDAYKVNIENADLSVHIENLVNIAQAGYRWVMDHESKRID